MPRPKKAIKRQEKLTLYYTKSEFRIISKLADDHGLSKAEFARIKSLNHTLKTRLTLEEVDLYKKLVGMSNNLNQLAHQANVGKTMSLQIIKTLEAIHNITDKLR